MSAQTTIDQNTRGTDSSKPVRALPEGSKRKPYLAPALTLHGDVTQITQQGAREFFLPHRGLPPVS
jgi:hypothetical protein